MTGSASAPKDAKNAKEATVSAPKNKKKKQKPPEAPEAPKRHDPRGGLAVCGVMVALAAAAAAYAHRTYGPEFFVSPAAKTLGWSAGDWRAALENRTVAFVGGQHRAGTRGRKRVIQVRFNMSVPRARVPDKASKLREHTES